MAGGRRKLDAPQARAVAEALLAAPRATQRLVRQRIERRTAVKPFGGVPPRKGPA